MVTQMKHLLSLLEYNESEFVKLLQLAEKIKADWVKGKGQTYYLERFWDLSLKSPHFEPELVLKLR